jgi:hypothetical protein
MDSTYEVVITRAIDISTNGGNIRVRRGVYIVKVTFDDRGTSDGAVLTRIGADVDPIRLTRAQYEMLVATRFFEQH